MICWLGWWEYAVDCPKPLIKRLCGLSETLGEKRLSDHLLVGLELLIPYLVDCNWSDRELLKLFSDERKDEAQNLTETWNYALIYATEGTYVDLTQFSIPFCVSAQIPASVPEKMWKERVTKIQSLMRLHPNVLAYLYWRLGREAGTIQRLLHQHHISWGTYVDVLGTHCNSHPNNFVVLPRVRIKTKNVFTLLHIDFF